MALRGIVTRAQAQGDRDYQEDYLVHIPFYYEEARRGHLLGVLDGHNGGEVAKYCALQIQKFFDARAPDPRQELLGLVAKLDGRTCMQSAGSTLSLAYVDESSSIVTTAVLGDSPIIVVDAQGVIHVSEEHNVRTNEAERRAVERRGGEYYDDGYIRNARGNPDDLPHWYGLQLSRALGDHALRKILDQTPVISQFALGKYSSVVVCSDGFFDPSHEESRDVRLEDVTSLVNKGYDSSKILNWRAEDELQDNTSLIIWRARRWWDWFL